MGLRQSLARPRAPTRSLTHTNPNPLLRGQAAEGEGSTAALRCPQLDICYKYYEYATNHKTKSCDMTQEYVINFTLNYYPATRFFPPHSSFLKHYS